MRHLFFSTEGRIDRQKFLIGFVCVSLFVFAGNTLLRTLGQSMTGFYIALFFPFISFYIIYCVYGKRLHDMGRTVRPFYIMIFLEIVAVIFVMLSFGGADYFSEFSQFDRKDIIDPAVTQDIIARYQDKVQANMPIIRPLLLGIPLLFTLWLGVAKSDPGENKYGPMPSV